MNNKSGNSPAGDIEAEADITNMVDRFYEKVRNDQLLAPVFDAAIQGNWPEHLQKMYSFWSTLLLHSQRYMGDPMTRHMALNIGKEHFTRWLQLFTETVDDLFDGPNAKEAKRRAGLIAKIMQLAKNEQIQNA
jgi:hemoglobin